MNGWWAGLKKQYLSPLKPEYMVPGPVTDILLGSQCPDDAMVVRVVSLLTAFCFYFQYSICTIILCPCP